MDTPENIIYLSAETPSVREEYLPITIAVPIKENYAGDYRIFSDGGDLFLEGKDKNHPDQWSKTEDYHVMNLAYVAEMCCCNFIYRIDRIDEKFIYVKIETAKP